MGEPDQTIELAALLRGEKTAWDSFVSFQATSVHWTVQKILEPAGASDDVGDVFQDVFLRLCRNDFGLLRRFDAERASLPTYVKVIARSAALDHLRRRQRQAPPATLRHEPGFVEPAAVERLKMPDGLLTPRQRLILALLYDRDMDVAEIAQLLRIEAQTVRSTHHKALERLRAHFGEEDAP